MKNLHFYIQCMMCLIALCIAVQIPSNDELAVYVVLIEFVLGVYQMGMSFMLMKRLSNTTKLLQIHFIGALLYISSLIILGTLSFSWLDEWWHLLLFVFPWTLAILFLVAIDELERARHYRL